LARYRSLPTHFLAASPLPARLVRFALTIAVLGCVVALAAPPAMAALGSYLVVEDAPAKADAIVVLSGDGGNRLEHGVRLFDDHFAPVLILTGAGQPGNPSAAEVMRQQAESMGVPTSAIFLVEQSTSTREDATYTRQLMAQHGWRSAILVTSAYHGRRASLVFARAFDGSGIVVTNRPVHDDLWQPNSWWTSVDTIRLTMNELIKLAYYELNGYL
jgi:uncharacterized SAM-binding protein YcdF (DUF218 family)